MTVFLLHLQNSLTLFPFGEGLPRFFIEIILLSIRPHSQKSTPEIKSAHADGVRRSTIPSAAKTAHAGIILPHMSGFLAVVDFLALDFLRHRGKRPCRALLGVQFFAGFLAELGAGDKLFYPQLGVKLCSMAGGGVQKIYMVFLREPSRRDRSGSDLFHLRDGFEIKMNFDRNVSCFIFVNALMHDDFFD